MARFSCGVHCCRAHCSTHDGTGSTTTVEQESQQVRPSGIDSSKCYVDYDTPYDFPIREEVLEIPGRIAIDLDGIDASIISEELVSTQVPNGASRAVGTHHGPTRIHLADYSLRHRRDGNAGTTIRYHPRIYRRQHSSSVMTAGRRELLEDGHCCDTCRSPLRGVRA